ncbi:glycine zipper 2TM domain-containing protein, partial [Acidovorax sp. SRB_24]|uniref:glycine zipper 2TM domain-containing protein n=1 Tax=Acidovorax sp. SRB_24 TaxID=1962700 RepID=UPI00145E58CC
PSAQAQLAQTAPDSIAKSAPPSAGAAAPRPQPVARLDGVPAPQAAVRAAVCAVCGQVESVQAVQQATPASGVGAVAGGVLGAVVGNQVGKGSGRAAATVLGAVGGGYLGHTVEQRTRTQTVYQVRVRMEDGSVRQFERAQPVPVGAAVTLRGKGFALGRGAAPSAQAGASTRT